MRYRLDIAGGKSVYKEYNNDQEALNDMEKGRLQWGDANQKMQLAYRIGATISNQQHGSWNVIKTWHENA